jgi:3-keto-L-gulonate-6-phosphate decarboxylase
MVVAGSSILKTDDPSAALHDMRRSINGARYAESETQ